MRGEYLTLGIDGSAKAELPPRARRIRDRRLIKQALGGTTSACAENTFLNASACDAPRNYLRVRGEYIEFAEFLGIHLELPPRARRIPTLPTHTDENL